MIKPNFLELKTLLVTLKHSMRMKKIYNRSTRHYWSTTYRYFPYICFFSNQKVLKKDIQDIYIQVDVTENMDLLIEMIMGVLLESDRKEEFVQMILQLEDDYKNQLVYVIQRG